MASYDKNEDTGDLHNGDTRDTALQKIRTAGSVSIPPDLFEKLYLTPQDAAVRGGLRSKIGNPTPLGLGGFLLALTPLTCDLMNWRQAAPGLGAASITAFIFFGGLQLAIACVFEMILGNTYIATVFGTFSAFWFVLGTTLQPFYFAYGLYSPNPSTVKGETAGLAVPAFNNAFGFFLVFMGVLVIVYLIGSIRTNLILVMILFPLPFAFAFLTAYFFYTGLGTMPAYAAIMRKAGGAFVFVTCMFGWYLFSALIFAALDFPFSLPVFDLSTKIKGASDKANAA